MRLFLVAMLAILPSSLIRAQEQPPTAPPVTRVIAHVKFCKVEFPTECRVVEMKPEEYERVTILECMRNMAMGSARFTYEGEEWHFKGAECEEVRDDYATWRQAHRFKP